MTAVWDILFGLYLALQCATAWYDGLLPWAAGIATWVAVVGVVGWLMSKTLFYAALELLRAMMGQPLRQMYLGVLGPLAKSKAFSSASELAAFSKLVWPYVAGWFPKRYEGVCLKLFERLPEASGATSAATVADLFVEASLRLLAVAAVLGILVSIFRFLGRLIVPWRERLLRPVSAWFKERPSVDLPSRACASVLAFFWHAFWVGLLVDWLPVFVRLLRMYSGKCLTDRLWDFLLCPGASRIGAWCALWAGKVLSALEVL